METRKNRKYDLERKRSLFFAIGLCISLGVTISAFEWASPESKINIFVENEGTLEEVIHIPPTTFKTPEPPKPKIKDPVIVETTDDIEVPDVDIVLDPDLLDELPEEVFVPEPDEKEEVPEIFVTSEVSPSPEGGMEAFYKHLRKHMKYPKQARRMGIEGKVFVQFVIWKDGSIRDIQAIKGIGSGCDKEAERVIRSFPAWKPGRQRGKPVSVRMVMPITFSLRK